jgi:hypothetical protein
MIGGHDHVVVCWQLHEGATAVLVVACMHVVLA